MLLPTLALLATLLPAAPAQTSGRARVERLDGGVARVSGPDLSAALLDGAVWITFEGFQPPPPAPWLAVDRAEVRLVGGDRLLGPITAGDGDYLQVELIGGAPLRVLIDRIESLTFTARLEPDVAAGLQPAGGGDRLYWMRPGGLDRVDGTVEAFEDGGVRFEGVLGSKLFPWEEVAALFVEPFAEEGEASDEQAGVPVVLDLIDGSRLRGRLADLDEARARLALADGTELTLPVPVLAELVPEGGPARFLSAMRPTEVVEGSPFEGGEGGEDGPEHGGGDELGMRWPHRMDRSVTGGPLVSGGVRSSRGIGVHAPSRLTFALDGAYRELRGAVGIDDTVLLLPHRGSVIFRLAVDGEVRWESPLVRGGSAPLEIPALPLEGASTLTLEVDMATRFHVADRANWMRMLLVK